MFTLLHFDVIYYVSKKKRKRHKLRRTKTGYQEAKYKIKKMRMTGWVNKGGGGLGQDAWDRGCSPGRLYSSAVRGGKVQDREGCSDMGNDRDIAVRFLPLNSRTRSSHQASMYGVCFWHALWAVRMYAAVAVLGVGGVHVVHSLPPGFLLGGRGKVDHLPVGSVCTHGSAFLCDSVISSGSKKVRPWRRIGTLKGAVVLHLPVRETFNK